MKGHQISKSTVRSVVVPTEHGGWGFTLEPVLLGVLVAPGWPTLGLAVAAIATFLTRRPLRMAFTDWRHHRRLERTGIAVGSIAALGLIAVAGLILVTVTAEAPFWWPLLIATPLVLIQLRYDLDNRGRELLPELFGPIALGATAPMMMLAGGLDWRWAVGAWIVLAGRIVPSILLVRVQIRRAKDQKFKTAPTTVTGIGAIGAVLTTAIAGWAPWISVPAAVLVATWDAISMKRPPVPAKTIGWTQMAVGLIVAILFAIGYHTGW